MDLGPYYSRQHVADKFTHTGTNVRQCLELVLTLLGLSLIHESVDVNNISSYISHVGLCPYQSPAAPC